ncbi:Dabb family protein [Microbacterium sp. EYE_5]|uniref:Dabb family protein n=1 Tax=unclassified Microbacterium TaxID=2609290 RepID=UPI0020053CB1|nr:MULTISPECIES: Dabb family protein [unclassified Microbacterium]MCK6080135.1 Dabb family protein [Microbacterium sp. EYE_382]MCK6085406.1 Dabb family protein [Microbacterium sp. EYE_384]MCK6122369.1 Dabb family protein [Microbacterium sp. EYE_80]MCK6126169.1 Dabb family protein [Microbacterium sp. EYE_79]MCK6141090.1 Dabb family protein [Microbacterium sp. EYE_39]
MIRHVVIWKMAADDAATRAAHAAEVARLLGGLDGVIPGVRSLSVGTNVAVPESNADVSLVLDLDDLDALQAYQEHPAHLEVVAYIRSVTGSRMAVDFEV